MTGVETKHHLDIQFVVSGINHFHRHPSRREREREELLRTWFGSTLATGEITAHQRGPQAAGAVVDLVLEKIAGLAPEPLLVSRQTEAANCTI